MGGGGHYSGDYNQSPPPAGTGTNAGPARSRLRILGQDGKNLKKKFVKIVPPGQFPALAPPYEWQPHERKDWKYPQSGTNGVYPKKQKVESRFFSKTLLVEFLNPPADPTKLKIAALRNSARVITDQIQKLRDQAKALMLQYQQKKAAAHAQTPMVRHAMGRKPGQAESTLWINGSLTRSTLKLLEGDIDDEEPHGLTNADGTPAAPPVRSSNFRPISVGLPRGPAEVSPGRYMRSVERFHLSNKTPQGLTAGPSPAAQAQATALSAVEVLKKQVQKQVNDIHEKQIPPLRKRVADILSQIKTLSAQRAANRASPASKPAQPAQPATQSKPSFVSRISHSLFGRRAG